VLSPRASRRNVAITLLDRTKPSTRYSATCDTQTVSTFAQTAQIPPPIGVSPRLFAALVLPIVEATHQTFEDPYDISNWTVGNHTREAVTTEHCNDSANEDGTVGNDGIERDRPPPEHTSLHIFAFSSAQHLLNILSTEVCFHAYDDGLVDCHHGSATNLSLNLSQYCRMPCIHLGDL
jgi:hypothetical protein